MGQAQSDARISAWVETNEGMGGTGMEKGLIEFTGIISLVSFKRFLITEDFAKMFALVFVTSSGY